MAEVNDEDREAALLTVKSILAHKDGESYENLARCHANIVHLHACSERDLHEEEQRADELEKQSVEIHKWLWKVQRERDELRKALRERVVVYTAKTGSSNEHSKCLLCDASWSNRVDAHKDSCLLAARCPLCGPCETDESGRCWECTSDTQYTMKSTTNQGE